MVVNLLFPNNPCSGNKGQILFARVLDAKGLIILCEVEDYEAAGRQLINDELDRVLNVQNQSSPAVDRVDNAGIAAGVIKDSTVANIVALRHCKPTAEMVCHCKPTAEMV
ncbi:MAG: hypothetical protein LBS91_02695 [Clostridiales Family XIII bacterium]|nr:hypothetical protein [Clostridiales Family XIII bacterium]